MEAACANNCIGYDQGQRNSLNEKAKAVGYDLSKVADACECDCSSLVSVCTQAAGIDLPYVWGNAPYTGNMEAQFGKTGEFEVLKDSKYLTSDAYLKRGDILLNTKSHTAMVLENGSTAGGNTASPPPSPGSTNTGSDKVASLKIGDVVQFTGTKHYISSNSANGKTCRPGKAQVTALAGTGKHPVHLVAVTGGGSNVYGWVDTAFIARESATLAVGARVKVNAGAKTYTGVNLASFVYSTTYDVLEIRGDRVVIGLGKSVTAAVNKNDLTLV